MKVPIPLAPLPIAALPDALQAELGKLLFFDVPTAASTRLAERPRPLRQPVFERRLTEDVDLSAVPPESMVEMVSSHRPIGLLDLAMSQGAVGTEVLVLPEPGFALVEGGDQPPSTDV